MNCIDRHINYLISQHDCVIIPGWGALVAQYMPAYIDDQTHFIHPPTRKIGFNQSLDHNDGLLANSISRADNMSYDEAVTCISHQVSALRNQLVNDGEVALGHVGTFTTNGNGAIVFSPFNTPITAPSYFGLPEVAIAKVIKVAKQEKNDLEKARIQKRRLVSDTVRKSFRIAASLALLIGLGIMLSTPVVVDRNSPSMASVSSMPSVTTPRPISPSELLPSSRERNLYIAVAPQGVGLADTTARQLYENSMKSKRLSLRDAKLQGSENHGVRMNDNDPYCLVVASLATREDADRYLRQQPDKTLRCLEKDGKFRIYAATGTTAAATSATGKLPTFARRYPGAWVCHR